MSNYSVKNVNDFIEAAPKEARPHLKEVQSAVKAAAPGAEELIGYGKPYYKQDGRWFVGYDVYKQHIGFEIWEGQLDKEFRKELAEKGYKATNKSFQIKYDQNVPITAIKKLVKAKAAEAKRIAKERK